MVLTFPSRHGILNHILAPDKRRKREATKQRDIPARKKTAVAPSLADHRSSSFRIAGKFHTQAYRSGHNEAVLKTVCLTGTGVRIPQPAPKNKDTPCGCPLFFATVRGSRTPLCDSPSRRMGYCRLRYCLR